MNCEVFRTLLGSYVDETLNEDHRRWFRRHLRECGSCRELAVRKEPSLLFAAAPEVPTESEDIEACAAAVTARIRQDRVARRLRRHRRPWLAAAAAAVMIVGGGLVWRAMYDSDEGTLQPAVEASRGLETPAFPPTVEIETRGEEIRVYQFATDGDADTAIYFIVDPALEL